MCYTATSQLVLVHGNGSRFLEDKIKAFQIFVLNVLNGFIPYIMVSVIDEVVNMKRSGKSHECDNLKITSLGEQHILLHYKYEQYIITR